MLSLSQYTHVKSMCSNPLLSFQEQFREKFTFATLYAQDTASIHLESGFCNLKMRFSVASNHNLLKGFDFVVVTPGHFCSNIEVTALPCIGKCGFANLVLATLFSVFETKYKSLC
jgi:hypothetical protein